MPNPDVLVKATITASFKPFLHPNFATQRSTGAGTSNELSVDLKEVDNAALDALAERWLDDVYKRAGKTNPWTRKAYRG